MPTAAPLASASLADWRAIFSVCAAFSAFCLMFAAICSIDADASSPADACSLAPCESCCGARRQFLTAGRDVVRRAQSHRSPRRAASPPCVPAPCPAMSLSDCGLDLHGQIAVRQPIGDRRGGTQFLNMRSNAMPEFVLVGQAMGIAATDRPRRSHPPIAPWRAG